MTTSSHPWTGQRRRGVATTALILTALALLVAACGGGGSGSGLEGRIEIDGSSTVAPLTTLAAEEFQIDNSGVRITVGISGSGGGFERFCNGETDLSNASRAITKDEAQACADNDVKLVELRVASDAVTVVLNPDNDWVTCLTTEQLAMIWAPESEGSVDSWDDVDPSFPDEPLRLAGPGTDSGTFDYFTDEINGAEGASRADYTASEDDNIVVQAVQGEIGGIGYFGFSYFLENPDALVAAEIDGGAGCVAPGIDTVLSGDYTPLSRPLYLYVNTDSLLDPAVQEFMRFYLHYEMGLAEAALFIPLTEEQLAEQTAALELAIRAASVTGAAAG